MSDEQTVDTFWDNVSNVGQHDVCWEWQAGCQGSGYGLWWDGTCQRYAHRVAYEKQYGAILPGLLVCHHCDNRRCCNPSHLFLGTITDNMRDRTTKGRTRVAVGEAQGLHKLTVDQVKEIRLEYATGTTTYRKLAQKYGVSHTVIRYVVIGKTWQSVS
jgi:hypothetical protein